MAVPKLRLDELLVARGLAESRAVFLDGCGLPERFAGRLRFAVGELGFGSGLNVLALLDLWRRHRPYAVAKLSIISIEAFPMTPDDAARALAAFPDLAELSADLLTDWPGQRIGRHTIDFPEIGATKLLNRPFDAASTML